MKKDTVATKKFQKALKAQAAGIAEQEKELEKERVKARSLEIMAAYHSGDPEKHQWAIETFFKENEGFLGFMIDKYFSAFKQEYYHDLYNEGVVAIMKDFGKFDPSKGTVTTFFTRPVLHAMSEFVNGITNKSTVYYAQIMNKIKNAQKHFEEQHVTPTTADIALYANLDIRKVELGLKQINDTNDYHYESEAELDSELSTYAKNPEQEYLENEGRRLLDEALFMLDEQARLLISLYFGFGTEKRLSYSQIGKEVGLTAREVSVVIARSLRTLSNSKELMQFHGNTMGGRPVSNVEISLVPDDDFIDYDCLDEDDGVPLENFPKAKASGDDSFFLKF